MFTLTDGRACFLDLGVAEKIAAAAVRTGKPFWINCKWDGKKGSPRIWEVWLDVNAGKPCAAEESAASLDTPWAPMVRERAQANIELCQSGFSEEEEEEEQEEELEPPDDMPEPPDDGLEPPEEEEQQGEQQ